LKKVSALSAFSAMSFCSEVRDKKHLCGGEAARRKTPLSIPSYGVRTEDAQGEK
jgi:hypothetical protein